MKTKRENILLVTAGKSYLDDSLKKNLEDAYFKVFPVVPTRDEMIHALAEQVRCMLLFVDENLLRERTKMQVVRDAVLEYDLPVFLLGQKEEVEKAQEILPAHIVQDVFVRPIDIKVVAQGIRDYVDKFGSNTQRNILVVDDSGAYLRSVKEWLGSKYQVTLANSATTAIKSMSLKRPDLVLLDYEMPVVDGKQVLEMIRSEPEFADIPVIFLTGKNDWESVMDVMSLEPSGYLLKSLPPKEILRNIEEFFEKGSLFEQRK